jgi:putative solute:sodium symporter small subunit
MEREMSAFGAHRRYRLQGLILAASLLGVLFIVVLTVTLGTNQFDQYHFFRFPFGFYLVAQALLIAIAAAGFWFAHVQERLDQELDESGEF